MSAVSPEPPNSTFDVSDDVQNHAVHTRPLTTAQERRLVDNLEERFLDLTRNVKKRSDPSSTTPTLIAYLDAARPLLALILQIPPLDPSASLRPAFLLRLTGDVLHAIPGYAPSPPALRALLDWLALLDRGWLAVLRSQAWDPFEDRGVDVMLDPHTPRPRPISQTDRARLRSLLVTGTSALEEWLASYEPGDGADGAEDYGEALARMGLQQEFDDLFLGTLNEMGVLRGAANDPAGMIGTC